MLLHALQWGAMLLDAVLFYFVLFYNMLCCAVLRHAMLFCPMVCSAVLVGDPDRWASLDETGLD